jgi:GPH family glycoside/pentoside/hexuronide:cation symporter
VTLLRDSAPKNSLNTSPCFVGKLKFSEKFFYGLGEVNQTVTYTIISMFIMIFLTDVAGISPIGAATIIMVCKIWDGINNPLMGIISDRTRSRWGRRRPYILWAAIPTAVFYIMMWSPVAIEGEFMKMLYYGGAYFLFATASSVFAIPYYSLGMELTDDYDERTSVSNFRTTIGLLFGFVAIILAGEFTSTDDPKTGFFMMGIALAVLSVIPILLVFFKTKERYTFQATNKNDYKLKEGFSLFKNGPFVWSCVIIFTNKIGIAIYEGFLVYYLTYWLKREDELTIMLLIGMVAWLASLPLWKLITKKTDKRFAYILTSAIWIIGSLMYLIPGVGSTSILPYIIQVVIGLGYGYAHVVPAALVPDVADLDELKTGKRREGLIWGMWNMFNVFGAAVAMMPVSMVLTAVGYVPNVPQTGAALSAMPLIMALGPSIIVLLGIIATLFYSIDKKRYKEIRAELEKRQPCDTTAQVSNMASQASNTVTM